MWWSPEYQVLIHKQITHVFPTNNAQHNAQHIAQHIAQQMLTHKLDHGPLTSTSPLVHHAQNPSKQAYPHRLYFLPPAKAGSVSPTSPFATFEDVQDDFNTNFNTPEMIFSPVSSTRNRWHCGDRFLHQDNVMLAEEVIFKPRWDADHWDYRVRKNAIGAAVDT